VSAPCIRIGGCLKPAPCLCDHNAATCQCREHSWYRENADEFVAAVRRSAITEAVDRLTDQDVEACAIAGGATWDRHRNTWTRDVAAFKAALRRALTEGT
jgi:hypothetical protein